jgi:hypothetical protein
MNATGDQEAAERSYRRAIAAAERQNAKALEVRAATNVAHLWRDQCNRAEARDLLAPIYGWFAEGFVVPRRLWLGEPELDPSLLRQPP